MDSTSSPQFKSMQFIELINWDKAQPLMEGDNNPWYKLYTSTLDNERIIQLDDAAHRLLINLWGLAARLDIKKRGNIMRADPAFLKSHLPYLIRNNIEPDLEPLTRTTDMYGQAAPFIRYCEAPAVSQTKPTKTKAECQNTTQEQPVVKDEKKDPLFDKAVEVSCASGFVSARGISAQLNISYNQAKEIVKSMKQAGLVGNFVHKKGFALLRTQSEQSREEETIPYRVSEEKRKEINPNGFKKNPTAEAQRQKQALLAAQTQDKPSARTNPTEPDESDESSVSSPAGQKQTTSSFRGGGAQSIGRIIKGDFQINDKKLPWHDAECVEFANAVLNNLDVVASDDEVGAFANWLFELKGVCQSREVIDELKDYMLAKARWVNSNKCKRVKNKGALLTSIVSGALAKRGIHLPDKRASPA